MLIVELVAFLAACVLVVLVVFWEVAGSWVTARWQEFQDSWREQAETAAAYRRVLEQEKAEQAEAAVEAEAELRREKGNRE